MQKLDIKINDNKEKYLEYKGTVLAILNKEMTGQLLIPIIQSFF